MNQSTSRPTSGHSCIIAALLVLVILAATTVTAGAVRARSTASPDFSGGEISVDTILTRASSPYTISEPITVTRQAQLTIEPGVELRFRPGTSLLVRGGLNAQGTHVGQIRMVAAETASWQGIVVEQPAFDVRLRSVTIQQADIGVALGQVDVGVAAKPGRVEIVDGWFDNNQIGVAADYTTATSVPSLTLRASLFTINGTAVLFKELSSGAKVKLQHNSFVGNGVALNVGGNGKLKAKQQWWGSAEGPLLGCDSPGLPGAGDRVCGLDLGDVHPWSEAPAGRTRLAAGASGIVQSELGREQERDDTVQLTSVVTLTVPTGTFEQPVDLLVSGRTLTETAELRPVQPELRPTQLFLEVTANADGQEIHQFAGGRKLTLTIDYEPGDLNGIDPGKLALYYWDETRATWSSDGLSTRVDAANRRISVEMEHLSRVGVMGVDIQPVFLPMLLHETGA